MQLKRKQINVFKRRLLPVKHYSTQMGNKDLKSDTNGFHKHIHNLITNGSMSGSILQEHFMGIMNGDFWFSLIKIKTFSHLNGPKRHSIAC